MDNFIVTGVCSYDPRVLRWIRTLRQVYDGKVILVLTDHAEMEESLKKDYNVDVWIRPEPKEFWHWAYINQWKYIKEVAIANPNSMILRTDVFDVVFQEDPRKYIDTSEFYISEEGPLNHENRAMIKDVANSTNLDLIKSSGYYNFPTINGGLISSTGEMLVKVANYILKNELNCDRDQQLLMLWLLENKIPYRYIKGFMENLYFKQDKVKTHNGKIVDVNTNKPLGVVHANCGNTEDKVRLLLESVYPTYPTGLVDFKSEVDLHNYFEEVICLTLEKRQDRRDQLAENLKQCNWPFRQPRFHFGKLMANGSNIGHREMISFALSSKNKRPYLFLEDDAGFVPDFDVKMKDFLKEVPYNWDALLIGGRLSDITNPIKKISNSVGRCFCPMWGAHCYSMRGKMLQEFHKMLHTRGETNDIMWAELFERYNVYCPLPVSPSIQLPSISDNNGQWANQENKHDWHSYTCLDLKIPQTFHFFWLGPNPLPEESQNFITSWKKYHPDWTIKLWKDEDVEEYPQLQNQKEFDSSKNYARKVDILRLEVLYREGGVTLDADFECLRSIEPLLHKMEVFAAEELPGTINVAILGSIPQHPFFKRLIDEIPNSINSFSDLVDQTGSGFITRFYKEYPDCKIFEPAVFYPYSYREKHRRHEKFPNAYAVHHWAGSWCAEADAEKEANLKKKALDLFLYNFFSKVICISLKRRQDRKDSLLKHLKEINWPFKPVEFFEAFDGSVMDIDVSTLKGRVTKGNYACTLSHLAFSKQAITLEENGEGPVLVIEDDAEFNSDFTEQIKRFLSSVPSDWNALMIGGFCANITPITSEIGKCNKSYGLHCYSMRGEMLINFFEKMNPKEEYADEFIGRMMPSYNVYCPMPFLSGQRYDYSDGKGGIDDDTLTRNNPSDFKRNNTLISMRNNPNDQLHGLCSWIKNTNIHIKKIVEVGCYAGESMEIINSHFPDATIHCIDPWKSGYDDNDGASKSNMEEVEKIFDQKASEFNNVIKHKGVSSDFSTDPELQSVDFVYIDGCHKYEFVKNDIALWKNRTSIIAGHDFNWTEVRQAVEENLPALDFQANNEWLKIVKNKLSSKDLHNYFEEVICLTLEKRQDRRDQLADYLKRCNWPFREPRFHFGKLMANGSNIGHREMIEFALSSKNKRPYLFLEDDAGFVPDFDIKMKDFLREVPSNWDALLIGGRLSDTSNPIKKVSNSVGRCFYPMWGAHCYSMRGKMLQEFYKMLNTRDDTNDIMWAELFERYNVYCPIPVSPSIQLPSISDNNGQWANQENKHDWHSYTCLDLKIPQTFHFFWLGPNPLPEESQNFITSWKKYHPDWTIKLWKDEDVPKLHNQKEFNDAVTYAQKVDILKYEILFREGGITIDTDFECLKCIEPLLHGVSAFSASEDEGIISIGIMGCVPNHPFFEKMVNETSRSFRENHEILSQTGPIFITRIHQANPDCKIFGKELFYPYSYREKHRRHEKFPNAYAVHHWAGSWCAEADAEKEANLKKKALEMYKGQPIITGVSVYTPHLIRWLHSLRKVYKGKVSLILADHHEAIHPLSAIFNVEIIPGTKQDLKEKTFKVIEDKYIGANFIFSDIANTVFQKNPTQEPITECVLSPDSVYEIKDGIVTDKDIPFSIIKNPIDQPAESSILNQLHLLDKSQVIAHRASRNDDIWRPIIGIAITTKDSWFDLLLCLQSILASSLMPDLIGVWVDGNAIPPELDHHCKFITQSLTNFGCVVTFFQGSQKGDSYNQEAARKTMPCDFIFRISDKHTLYPSTLESLFAVLVQNPKIGAVGGLVINSLKPTETPELSKTAMKFEDLLEGKPYPQQFLLNGNSYEVDQLHSAYMYRRELDTPCCDLPNQHGLREEAVHTNLIKNHGYKVLIIPKALTEYRENSPV